MQGTKSIPAIIAKRVDSGTADTAEIHELARAAGYEVLDTLTQTRKEDAEFGFGAGKVDELVAATRETGATAVLCDNRLGPYQTYNLGTRLPPDTEVIDRFTLILEIFAQRAQTRKAQLQVELAELRYELPRVEAKVSLARREEHPGFMGLGEYDESRERDIKSRISNIRAELERIEKTDSKRRKQRRESGFDLVALAGYTNAGKSTLLQRLADDIEFGENDDLHPDLDPTAEAQDRLFTTLGTTTRRMAMDRRDVLLTDTVGFVRNLPHWLVESFKSTLDEVYQADLVLLVVDVSDPVEEIQEKLVTSHDVLCERNEAPILTVLNKIDQVSEDELAEKRRALSALAPDPIEVSAARGTNVSALQNRIHDALPERRSERLVLPMTEETMSLVSWVYDHAYVEEEQYADDQVIIAFEAIPSVIERARARASDLVPAAESV